jgi:outer membrane protein assembly factor BamB
MSDAALPLDQVTFRRRGAGLIGHDPARAAGGYTLIAPQTAAGAVHLVAMDGSIVHRWQLPMRPGRHAVLLPNGNLGYNGNLPGQPDLYPAWSVWHGGAFLEVTPTGEVVWQHTDPMHHHDAQWLANGHLLYGACEKLDPATAARIQGGTPARGVPAETVYGDVVREVDRAGAIVWEWRAAQHLDPAEFPIHPFFDRSHWPLINSVGPTRGGLVLMSLRTTSGVIGVDRATGEVVLRIPHGTVSQQHAPVELDSGNILIFDNGNFRPGVSTPFSRVIEVDPTTGAIVWQYHDPLVCAFFSPYMGAAQRLWNGNTHITESATGRLFEVTPEGRVVWEYVIPDFAEYDDPSACAHVPGFHNSVFKSFRYRRDDIPWL